MEDEPPKNWKMSLPTCNLFVIMKKTFIHLKYINEGLPVSGKNLYVYCKKMRNSEITGQS